MWKDYSVSYLKKNKAASLSVMIAAFIAAMFISMLCTLFYNMWTDDIRRLIDREGDWQARIMMEFSENELQRIQNYSNVKAVIVSEEGAAIYFNNSRTIYTDMPQIAGMLNVSEDKIEYHSSLLSKQLLFFSGKEEAPSMLVMFYVLIVIFACISLMLIIKSAFQFSMNTRVYQLGILQSVGATPKQLRTVLIQEALVLSTVPVLAGTLIGIGLCVYFLKYANTLTRSIGIKQAVFEYHVLLFLLTVACTFVTIFLSAWFPARNLSKISVLQAIRGEYEKPQNKIRKFRVGSVILGVEGELALKSFYTRRKAFRTAAVCLTISFLVLTIFLNFMTISEITTKYTYFERYKNSWDIMIEIANADLSDDRLQNAFRSIDGIDTLTAYQKNTAYTLLSEEDMSQEVKAIGGYNVLNPAVYVGNNKMYLVETPMIVLDHESYADYAEKNGIPKDRQDVGTAILINTIWDSKNSGFRSRELIPFLSQTAEKNLQIVTGRNPDTAVGTITVSGYTEEVPQLREEYSNYSLVLIISQNAYDKFAQSLPAADDQLYFNIRAASADSIDTIQAECEKLMGSRYNYTIENRPEKEETAVMIYAGYKQIIGALCGLLACIGISNVFANTLGNIFQRKREFARYQSVGVTPRGISKILCTEAFVIWAAPMIISIPFNILFIVFAVKQAGINMSEFIVRMPILPMLIFSFAVLMAISISYFIGSRQMKGGSIAEALKDDTFG